MTSPSLDPWQATQLTVQLMNSPQFKGKDFRELFETACQMLLHAADRAPVIEKVYQDIKLQLATERLPPDVSAKLITGISRSTQAKKLLQEFWGSLPRADDTLDIRQEVSSPQKGFTHYECEQLRPLFRGWYNMRTSEAQSKRAKKRIRGKS